MDNIFSKIAEIYSLCCEYLYTLIQTLDGITFDETTEIYQFFGVIRYYAGDVLYLCITSILSLGALFLLYKLFSKVINTIISLIPGIKGGIV